MLKLDTIAKICAGLAWAKDVTPWIDTFEITAELPFPFYDALQREMMEMAADLAQLRPEFAQPMKFLDISFPNGIVLHITPGERILFEVGRKQKDKINSTFLRPGGDRN